MITVTCFWNGTYVFGDGVIEMPSAGLAGVSPRPVPANHTAYEGLGIFVNEVDSRGKKESGKSA